MQLKKRLTAAALALAVALAVAGCGSSAGGASSAADTDSQAASSAASAQSAASGSDTSSESAVRPDDGKKLGYQLEKPAVGEEVAVLQTSLGTIKVRLFPEAAPKTVENFKGLIKKGYYNGVTFHRVIKDFMIQSGDPTATGSGGDSIWNENFSDEFNANLVNLRGSLAMANSGYNTNGSQFFINQAPKVESTRWDQVASMYKQLESYDKSEWSQFANSSQYYSILDPNKLTDAYKALYEKQGGNPNLDGAYNAFTPPRGHSVFGQVYEGLDIVDKIAAVKVDSAYKPLSTVKIVKATLEKYAG